MPFLAPVITAVAGWVGTTLAAGGIGAMLLRLGGSLLFSYASQALMPKPKTPARTVTVRAPVMPRDLVYGRARKGGVIVFLHASGAKSQYLHLVVVLAAHRVKAIGAIWFEGEMAVDAAGVAVRLAAGGSEPRYGCNGAVSLSQDPKTVIEAMLSAMAGRVAHAGGAWRLMAGAYRLPGVTLTADDVRAGGMVLATRISRAESFNAVRGQFVSPENDWQADYFPAVTSEVYRTEDGGEEAWRDLSLPFTISSSAAQRLAKIELERARRQMSLRIAGKLSAWAAAVGETVLIDYPRWGFAAKPFEVQSVSLDLTASGDGPALLPELMLRETSPLVYDWDASEEAIYGSHCRTATASRQRLRVGRMRMGSR